ncbi:PEP-CTERM sorting domain-containing protein [Dechloromonas sp. HYN0024]|uniref:PEP-CTERM sorting domain-containing protein n=1 Tax=Dechloromonas sp. HYN0024 TaxID=2231055 RepID=UPI00196865BC|nr:PEP-CTERM sorting domain-containing protein [Dechloromonas sp. HYN0024]
MNHRNQLLRLAPAALLVLSCVGQAHASTPLAYLTIDGADANGNAMEWRENMSGLISVDASGNIALRQGSTNEIYRNTATDQDFWQWTANANGSGSWNWHTFQTAGAAGDPLAVVSLDKIIGHGDPDLSYGFYAKNNTNSTQTYTLTIGESITPPTYGPTTVYADIGASLTNPSGNLTFAPVSGHIQQFMLSSDGGLSFVNAGVDVGGTFTTSTTGTSSYLAQSQPLSGPTPTNPATEWNFMQLVTRFTLSPNNDIASVSGFASINPVPEPSSYLMMFAGLCLLGGMTARNSGSGRNR